MDEPACEAERRLGINYINAASHGNKSHLGKLVGDDVALLLFDKPSTNQTIVALWDLKNGQAITSKDLPFPLGMLWDWDWRAEMVQKAFNHLLETRNSADFSYDDLQPVPYPGI